ncbi:MAG: ion channel [Caulobacterales bacterium]
MADDEEAELHADYPRYATGDMSDVVFLGQPKDRWRDAYHYLLTMPLWQFLTIMASGFLTINLVFGLGYLGVGGISGARPGDFGDAFFFSVQTLGTLGYGVMAPASLPANLLVTAEVFVGLFNLAIATGLLFARISRPTARVMFSDRAVITDFEGVQTLIFRAANRRRNRIVEADVSVSLVQDIVTADGHSIRRFADLPTVRSRSPIFYLTWQIMHRVDEASPLHGETMRSLLAKRSEIVVVLKGLDETFAQTIHARASYTPDEIVWGRRLVDIFSRDGDGRRVIDYTHFHDVE